MFLTLSNVDTIFFATFLTTTKVGSCWFSHAFTVDVTILSIIENFVISCVGGLVLTFAKHKSMQGVCWFNFFGFFKRSRATKTVLWLPD